MENFSLNFSGILQKNQNTKREKTMERLQTAVLFSILAAFCLLIGYSLGMVHW
nr:MAG TPA: hypothetical protein [Caudoviricetes sp.]